MANYDTIEKYRQLLSKYGENGAYEYLSERDRQVVERLQYILSKKIDNINITDRELFGLVRKQGYNIAFPQFLRDVSIVERIIGLAKYGNMDPMKAWVRYFIFENLKEAMEIAKAEGDSYKMAYIANMIGKHYLTDHEDEKQIDYDMIKPFTPEITSDPSVLGIEPIPDLQEKIVALAKKFGIDYEPIPGIKIEKRKKK